MSPSSAVLGALVTSLWQVALLALAFAVLRLTVKRPQVRYVGAVTTLALQLAWPAWTCARLLEVKLFLGSPPTLETSGQWDWVPLLWSVGAVAMLARTLGGLLVVRRWVTRSEPPAGDVVARLETVRARLTVRAVRWAVSRRMTVPLTVGFLRPVVLLPVALVTAVPGGDLELLAAHELMHVRRWDYLVNLGQALVEAVLFFHPAMWWVSRCAREEREYCCDDAVIARLGAARPYAQALLSLEQSLAPVAVAVPSTGGQFMNRIRRILGARSTSSSLPFALPLVGLAALVVVLGACAAQTLKGGQVIAAPPELVPSMHTLCADLRTLATGPKLATLPDVDLMTAVVDELREANPKFAEFMNEVSKVPVPERRDTFKRSVASAIGTPAWACADFDALWDGTFKR